MRKWAFIFSAAAIAVAGCGGSGSGSGPAKVVTKPPSSGIKANLSSVVGAIPPGAIEVAYLTGQGRAPGDLTAVVRRIVLDDAYGEVTNPLAPQTDCPLVGYQDNIVHLDVLFTGGAVGVPSRLFTAFNLDFLQFNEATSTPGQYTVFPEPASFPLQLNANIRVFPGRTTSFPVFIDDSMFTVDTSNPGQPVIAYNSQQFTFANGGDTQADAMQGHISDYVAFNLNSVAASGKPTLLPTTNNPSGGQIAQRVFFSGDVYGVSDGVTNGSNFQALTLNPNLPIGGLLGAAGTLNGPSGTLPHAGTYSLLQYNPTDLTQTLKIIAGQGVWYEHKTVLTHPDGTPLGAGFFVVTFPSSNDDNMQEMVAFVQDANSNISQLYFGYINMSLASTGTNGPTAFYLYPVSDIMSGATNGQLTGTITNLYRDAAASIPTNSPDLVHTGTFQFSTGDGSANIASSIGFKNGTFYVYRL